MKDDGATASFIRETTARQIKTEFPDIPRISNQHTTITTACGKKIAAKKRISLPLIFYGFQDALIINHTFVVVPDDALQEICYIGSDFLQSKIKHNETTDFLHLRLTCKTTKRKFRTKTKIYHFETPPRQHLAINQISTDETPPAETDLHDIPKDEIHETPPTTTDVNLEDDQILIGLDGDIVIKKRPFLTDDEFIALFKTHHIPAI